MSIFMGPCWQCESCGNIDNGKPWDCPNCSKETCEHCFDRYMICCNCGVGKTDADVKAMSEAAGFDWSEDERHENGTNWRA